MNSLKEIIHKKKCLAKSSKFIDKAISAAVTIHNNHWWGLRDGRQGCNVQRNGSSEGDLRLFSRSSSSGRGRCGREELIRYGWNMQEVMHQKWKWRRWTIWREGVEGSVSMCDSPVHRNVLRNHPTHIRSYGYAKHQQIPHICKKEAAAATTTTGGRPRMRETWKHGEGEYGKGNEAGEEGNGTQQGLERWSGQEHSNRSSRLAIIGVKSARAASRSLQVHREVTVMREEDIWRG